MINLIDTATDERSVYVFFHGAYQSPWMWKTIVDDIQYCKGGQCVLMSLPGYSSIRKGDDSTISALEKSAQQLAKLIENKNVNLVGSSLGGIYACHLAPLLRGCRCINVYVINVPSFFPRVVLKFRLFIGNMLSLLGRAISRKKLPLILRGRFASMLGKTDLIYLLADQDALFKVIAKPYSRIVFRFGLGLCDPIQGPMLFHKRFFERARSMGGKVLYDELGFSAHVIHLLRRSRVIDWILFYK